MLTFLPGIRFEAVPDVAPVGAGAPDPAAVVDPPPVPLPVEPAGDPAAPAADPAAQGGLPDPSELFGPPPAAAAPPDPVQQLGQQVGTLAEMIAQQQRQQGQPQGDPAQPDPYANWDPFDAQSVVQQVAQPIMQQITQLLDQRLGGIEQVSNIFAEREATDVANRHFDTIAEQIGPFDKGLAMEFLGHALAQGQDPSRALVAAAQRSQEFKKAAMIEGATAYRDLVTRAAAGASPEPAAGQGGATPVPEVKAEDGASPYAAQGRATLARLRALPPAGA